MAEKDFTRTVLDTDGILGVLYKWAGVSNADTCVPIKVSGSREALIQASTGSWGAGDTVKLHGSITVDLKLTAARFGPLGDGSGTVISLTDATVKYIGPLPPYFKPVPGGSTGTTWDIYMLVIG